mmetsp:Transcript_84471/g.133819  ORF Transcript_84471/g.133819 Transcript_84471/m.133819 type:complete len:208 (+) Transcript_84471:1432-2055(+)
MNGQRWLIDHLLQIHSTRLLEDFVRWLPIPLANGPSRTTCSRRPKMAWYPCEMPPPLCSICSHSSHPAFVWFLLQLEALGRYMPWASWVPPLQAETREPRCGDSGHSAPICSDRNFAPLACWVDLADWAGLAGSAGDSNSMPPSLGETRDDCNTPRNCSVPTPSYVYVRALEALELPVSTFEGWKQKGRHCAARISLHPKVSTTSCP